MPKKKSAARKLAEERKKSIQIRTWQPPDPLTGKQKYTVGHLPLKDECVDPVSKAGEELIQSLAAMWSAVGVPMPAGVLGTGPVHVRHQPGFDKILDIFKAQAEEKKALEGIVAPSCPTAANSMDVAGAGCEPSAGGMGE